MYKCSHQELTVESVHDTTMSRYGVTKVLLEKCIDALLRTFLVHICGQIFPFSILLADKH